MTAMIVLPESGLTRSLHSSQSCTPTLASDTVVRIPSASAPTPAAMIAAEIGPSGRSGYSMAAGAPVRASDVDIAGSPSRVDRLGDRLHLGDECAQRTRHRGECERQHEQGDGGLPDAVVTDQVRAVVEDDERHDRREYRADPGDVLLPFHAELVPIHPIGIGQELRPGALGYVLPVPRIDDPG